VFRFIAASGVREVFTAATLLLVLDRRCLWTRWGCRWRSGPLSPACCWRKASIATSWKLPSIRSKGCCWVVLYFVGMALNLGVLYTHLLWVVVSVAVLVAVKMLVLYAGAYLWPAQFGTDAVCGRVEPGRRVRVCAVLTASSQKLFKDDQMALLVTVTLSMMTTPLLMKLVDKLLSRRLNPRTMKMKRRGWKTINRR
jgi:glutathione-regulated potassium-efflux system protein KefB